MRGYGRSSAPAEIEAYDIVTLCGDLTGLLDALGEERAIFVGHDWGAIVVWNLSLLAPERVRAVAGLSVPFVPRAPAPPTQIMRRNIGEDFYIVWFQEPGVGRPGAGRGRAPHPHHPAAVDRPVGRGSERSRGCRRWLSEEELAVYVEAFERTGFTGGLNYYRNLDRNWELTADVADRHVQAPAMFLTGERDLVRLFAPGETMDDWVDDLRARIVVPKAGHWVQQQASGARSTRRCWSSSPTCSRPRPACGARELLCLCNA